MILGERGSMKQGFTLIELMIVVAIVSFLSAVAIPQCFKYQARAKQAEAAVFLASLHTAEVSYYAQHTEYTDNLAGEHGLGWKPEGYLGGGKQEKFYYTYGFNSSDSAEGINYFTGKCGTTKNDLGQTRADKSGFIIRAAADLLGNGKLDIWQIDQNRTISHIQNGLD